MPGHRRISLHIAAVLIAPLACSVPNAPAQAGDPLGTAGPFRSSAWAKCAAGVVEQFRGACDPPAVDPALPAIDQSKAHVERAVTLISLGRIPQAHESLNAAVSADPRNLMALKLRARIAIPGNGDGSEADVNAGLLLDPSDADLLAMRAMHLQDAGNPRAALRDADRAVSLSSRNADVLWMRARILLVNMRFKEAEADLTQALAIEPDYFRARHLRGAVRIHIEQYGDAFEDANRAVTLHPADVSALQLRAMARAGLGDFQGLVDDLTIVLGEPGRPINADPSWALFNGLYIQRAIALVRLGRQQEAMADIETVSKLGGQRSILRMQVYLRSNGFPDVKIDGKRSQLFDDAMKACFIDKACGRGIAERT
jgi:tetratricopeptide (TPR) repeat protein